MKNIPDSKRIKKIILPATPIEQVEVSDVCGKQLYIMNDFHGEYCIDWVIVEQGGVEIARYNCKFIETIIWDEKA